MKNPQHTLSNDSSQRQHNVKGPLKGIRILDLSRLLPGPLGSMLLAEMGAEVIKIEDPDHPDYVRNYPPHINGVSANYLALNRTKKSICLNIFEKEGQQKFLEMVKKADIVVEQFRPGVMNALNIGFEQAKAVNNQIIYISLSGYGQSGPMAHKAGHDLNYMAKSGLLSMNKDQKGRPVIPAFQLADISGGAYMLMNACTTALFARERDQQAIHADVAMLDGIMPLTSFAYTHQQFGESANMLDGRLANYNVYQCKDKKWIALAALEPKFWKNFCKLIGKPEWKDFLKPEQQQTSQLHEQLENLFKTKTSRQWEQLAEDSDVCLTVVNEISDLDNDAQLRARDVFVRQEHEKAGTFSGIGNPIKFNQYPEVTNWVAPDMGQDEV